MVVQDLLQLPSFEGALVLSGEAELDRKVKNIKVLEATDIIDEIAAGTFLLSTLYPVLNNESQQSNFIQKLVSMGLSGIGIKLSSATEAIPAELIAQANTYGFVIIQLQEGTTFSFVITDFLNQQIRLNTGQLEYRNYLHDELLDIMLQGGEYETLASSLSRHIGRTVRFLDAGLEELAVSLIDPISAETEAPSPSDVLEPYLNLFTRDLLYFEDPTGWYCAYHVQDGFESSGYIVIGPSETSFQLLPLAVLTIEQYSTVFTIISQRHKHLAELEKRYEEEFVSDLIYGKLDSEGSLSTRAKKLGFAPDFPMQMAILQINDPASNDRYATIQTIQRVLRNKLSFIAEQPEALLLSSFEQNYIFFFNQSFIAKADGSGKSPKRAKSLQSAKSDKPVKPIKPVKQIKPVDTSDLIYKVLAESGFKQVFLGLSEPFDAVQAIPERYLQCKLATRVAVDTNSDRPLNYRNLGIFRLLHLIDDREKLEDYCQDILGPVIEYDLKNSSDLLTTLNFIVLADGNLKNAAARMFVHYNTIRYRYKRIMELLERDLDSISALEDVYIALKIYWLLK